jgi:hypothetical protein
VFDCVFRWYFQYSLAQGDESEKGKCFCYLLVIALSHSTTYSAATPTAVRVAAGVRLNTSEQNRAQVGNAGPSDGSPVEIVDSNPTGGMNVCRECCVLSGRGLCDGLITRPDESY